MPTSCKFALYLLFISLLLLPSTTLANTITGTVVSVADGDTITILTKQNKKLKIRFHGIDTPEKKQAYGQQAKKYTASKVAGKIVTIRPETTDKYGRTVATVFVNGSNLNEQIVADGYGWVYRKYCKQSYCKDWLKLEENAKSFYFGLWADPNPVPPWEWRKAKRNSSNNRSSNVVGGLGIYHGNARSKALHGVGCKYYNCKNCTVVFKSVQAGVNAGYRPHYECIE